MVLGKKHEAHCAISLILLLFPLGAKYLPQHPILQPPQTIFFT